MPTEIPLRSTLPLLPDLTETIRMPGGLRGDLCPDRRAQSQQNEALLNRQPDQLTKNERGHITACHRSASE